MTPNPDKATKSLEEFLESCEFADDDEFTPEELAEADAAHEDYLAGRDPGKSLRQVRQELDPTVYSTLLVQAAPKLIETEAEYDRMLCLTEQLHFKKDRTLEERALYKLLVALVERYESEPVAMAESQPHEILQHIMEASGTRQSPMVGTEVFTAELKRLADGLEIRVSEYQH